MNFFPFPFNFFAKIVLYVFLKIRSCVHKNRICFLCFLALSKGTLQCWTPCISVFYYITADQESANFLASKERVNLPLPKTPDPKFKRWKGYIEELHIPDGGIIRLTESKAMPWEARRQRVYFHRSRLFVNGVKIYNQDILEEQVAVGDVVQVDLIINQIDLTAAYVSQVDVHWVAISVKANVSERGVLLANKLRSEVPEKTLELENYRKFWKILLALATCYEMFIEVDFKMFSIFSYFRVLILLFMKRKFAKEEWFILKNPNMETLPILDWWSLIRVHMLDKGSILKLKIVTCMGIT